MSARPHEDWYAPMTRREAEEHARNLLSNPLLLAAFRDIARDALETWKAGTNTAQREEQWHKMHAISRLQLLLTERLSQPQQRAQAEQALKIELSDV